MHRRQHGSRRFRTCREYHHGLLILIAVGRLANQFPGGRGGPFSAHVLRHKALPSLPCELPLGPVQLAQGLRPFTLRIPGPQVALDARTLGVDQILTKFLPRSQFVDDYYDEKNKN